MSAQIQAKLASLNLPVMMSTPNAFALLLDDV